MYRRRPFVALALASAAAAPANTQSADVARAVEECKASVVSLRRTLEEEPGAYALRKAAEHDYRYLEVHGVGGVTPGIKDPMCVHENSLSVRLVGTSDVICTADQQALNEAAYTFARTFNARMVQLRKGAALRTCHDDG